jgi:tryptophan synthase alpha chain
MAHRIDQAFARLKQENAGALVTFVTAGDPSVEGAADLVVSLAKAGADIIELGIPYSDPLADGPTIQWSSQRALDRGMNTDIVFDIVRDVRTKSEVPIVLMSAYALIVRYGLERFARTAAEAGVDGTILTDLPPEESKVWKELSDAHGLATIFLVAPTSTETRIQLIAKYTTGFVYCVSRTGVTGAQSEIPSDLKALLAHIRELTDKPLCVGFGVSKPEHVAEVVQIADGAVIGSTLVDFLHKHADDRERESEMSQLVQSWKAATRHI